MFILVVVAFPDGLAGVYCKTFDPALDRLLPWLRRRPAAPRPAVLPGAPVASTE